MKKGFRKIRNLFSKRSVKIGGLVILAILLFLSFVVLFSLTLFKDSPVKKEKIVVVDVPLIKKKSLGVYDVKSNRRPIAIMIDNNVGNSNHVGLQDAYLSYEVIVEGGLTRIMAIFKDKDPEVIGPVRSSRHYFLDYALENDAIYAHYGWSPYAENDIKVLGVNNINGLYNNYFYRDRNYRAPHNVFTNLDKLYEGAKNLGYSVTSRNYQNLDYTGDEVNLNSSSDSMVANDIMMYYSYHQSRSYKYDSENKYYVRYMNGRVHKDRDSGIGYHYKNIIIMRVNSRVFDSYGRYDVDTVSSGDGYYITNGYLKNIRWSKGSRSSKTSYTYSDGSRIKVNDGNTFIQVVPINSDINFS